MSTKGFVSWQVVWEKFAASKKEREECRAPRAARLGWEQAWFGCGAVIPPVLPVTSRLALLVLVGLPKLFRVSPDIYYSFCLDFFFF